MVLSARRATIAVLGLSTLTGCATTQQEAARLRLNDARIRASQAPLELVGRDRTVSVTSIAVIAGRSAAVIVTLRNNGARPVSDLPLLVGITSRGKRTYLNQAAGETYFQNHVPAIAAHGLLRWVLTPGRSLPTASVPFVRVGIAVGDTATTISTLPLLRIGSRDGLVEVNNTTSVPQYQLPVYAVAVRRGRDVAAGQTTIAYLGSEANVQLRVPLIGSTSGAILSLEAPPTIFK